MGRFKKLKDMRPKSIDYRLWRCVHCNVGVLTRDMPGHYIRCRGGGDGKHKKHFKYDRDLAA